jgi:hypothetical protein
MKSRSSTGVGQKIDLEYNMETMRITDEGGEDGDSGGGFARKPSTSLMDSIKAKSRVVAEDNEGEPAVWNKPSGGTHAWDKPMSQAGNAPKATAEVQSAKLKQLLGQIKQS